MVVLPAASRPTIYAGGGGEESVRGRRGAAGGGAAGGGRGARQPIYRARRTAEAGRALHPPRAARRGARTHQDAHLLLGEQARHELGEGEAHGDRRGVGRGEGTVCRARCGAARPPSPALPPVYKHTHTKKKGQEKLHPNINPIPSIAHATSRRFRPRPGSFPGARAGARVRRAFAPVRFSFSFFPFSGALPFLRRQRARARERAAVARPPGPHSI